MPEESSRIAAAFQDYQCQTYDYRDYYVGRCYLDFVVGTYSVFETWMTRLYAALSQKYPPSPSKRRAKMKRLAQDYADASDEVTQDNVMKAIAKLVSGKQSGAGLIQFVFSKMASYTRPSADDDLKLIGIYAAMRNSVHNMGISEAKLDQEIVGKGFEITMPRGLAAYTSDHSDRTRLCAELVTIYAAIVRSLDFAGQPCCMVIARPRL